MKEVNQITICTDRYDSHEEFEDAIKKVVMSLLDNGYIMTIAYDADGTERNVAVINYNYADQEFGYHYPYWLSPDEVDSVVTTEYV